MGTGPIVDRGCQIQAFALTEGDSFSVYGEFSAKDEVHTIQQRIHTRSSLGSYVLIETTEGVRFWFGHHENVFRRPSK